MSSTAGLPGGVPVEGEGRGRDVGGALEGGAGESPLSPPLAGPVPPGGPGVPGTVIGPGQAPPVVTLIEGAARDVSCGEPDARSEPGEPGERDEPGVPEGLRRGPWDDGLPVSPSSGISRTPPVGGTTPEREVPGPAAPVAT
ncbi:hypothetical protein ACQEVX_18730 [Streptomyces syringium]|uniref:hypothetical protein n=1 Tax=Streptomyces syringium TaxID=76729 RepID=UPI003D925F2A